MNLKQGEKNNYKISVISKDEEIIGFHITDLLNKINSFVKRNYSFYLPLHKMIVFEEYSFISNVGYLKNLWCLDIKFLNTLLDIIQDKIMNCDEYPENIKDEICSEIQNYKIKNI